MVLNLVNNLPGSYLHCWLEVVSSARYHHGYQFHSRALAGSAFQVHVDCQPWLPSGFRSRCRTCDTRTLGTSWTRWLAWIADSWVWLCLPWREVKMSQCTHNVLKDPVRIKDWNTSSAISLSIALTISCAKSMVLRGPCPNAGGASIVSFPVKIVKSTVLVPTNINFKVTWSSRRTLAFQHHHIVNGNVALVVPATDTLKHDLGERCAGWDKKVDWQAMINNPPSSWRH